MQKIQGVWFINLCMTEWEGIVILKTNLKIFTLEKGTIMLSLSGILSTK